MVASRNPFTPGFGSSPPLLAGRDELLGLIAEALEARPGHPARSTLYVGARGTGKTAMLNAVEDEARQRGWIVISENAGKGLAARLVGTQLPAALQQVAPPPTRHRLEGFTTPVGGLAWSTTEGSYGFSHNLRSLLTTLCARCAEHDTGVMLTIDELHARTVDLDELDEFANVAQHCIRESQPFAVVVAGLPGPTHARLLSADADRPITFFRRADRHELGAVDLSAVEEALYVPILDNGKTIDGAALWEAATATEGYPFMIQLVGFHTWREAEPASRIDIDAARRGIDAAVHRIGQLVHAPALSDLSDVDRKFLAAMSRDDGPSAIADVAARLGVNGNYATRYRSRLLTADMIVEAGHGKINFKLPYLREFLRERNGAMADVPDPPIRETRSPAARILDQWSGRSDPDPPPPPRSPGIEL